MPNEMEGLDCFFSPIAKKNFHSPLEENKHLERFTHHFFFFANPRSGDQTAAKFLHPDFNTF
jgi:hypothetical protein